MPDIRLLELRTTYKCGGGPDKTILLSAKQHNRSRLSVVLAYIRDIRDQEFKISEKARDLGVTYHEIQERGKFDPRVLRAIRELVQRYNINLIHAHDHKTDLFAYLLRCRLRHKRIALVTTAHGWTISGIKGSLYRRLDMLLMRRFDRLIAVSQATKALMVASGIPDHLISVVYNGIDTETWVSSHGQGNLREELGLKQAFPVVGYVGRLTAEKDLGTWLRAAAMLATWSPHARFILVGEGRDHAIEDQFRAMAKSLGISERVLFLGYRADLLRVYSTFDLFMQASLTEGLSNTLLEAMAMGLPVVTTAVGGSTELVLDGETGILRQPGDPSGLAKALHALAGDPALRRRMGEAARQRIERSFSFAERLKRIEDLYEQVVTQAHGLSVAHTYVRNAG